jgi:S-(hydroxymethyl)glutathione dehydrogenase / alcohol dehydrogenase
VVAEGREAPTLASAAVFDGSGLVVVDDVEVAAPAAGEVTVRLLASGICHSDLNVLDGSSPYPPPVVLGHEGAGVIERVGPGVEGWWVGRAVALHTLTPCGRCPACRRGHPTACPEAFGRRAHRFTRRGREVAAYANVGSFSERTTVSARQLVGVEGIALRSACLLGCAVSTGVGTVRNVASVGTADRVAVIGVGGIGANAIQAARLAGAAVTAVDRDPGRRIVAERFGATAFAAADGLDDLRGSFDVVIECSGAPAAIESAIALTAPGGTTALVGLPTRGHRTEVDVTALMAGRTIVGSFNGDTLPERDFPEIVGDVRAGRLDLDGLVSAVWPLEEIADAVAAVRAGEVLRAVLDLGDDRRPGPQVVDR